MVAKIEEQQRKQDTGEIRLGNVITADEADPAFATSAGDRGGPRTPRARPGFRGFGTSIAAPRCQGANRGSKALSDVLDALPFLECDFCLAKEYCRSDDCRNKAAGAKSYRSRQSNSANCRAS